MARTKKTVIVSDLSGEVVPDDKAVQITVSYADRTRGRVVLDASEDEVADLVAKGRRLMRRGRARARVDDPEGRLEQDPDFIEDAATGG